MLLQDFVGGDEKAFDRLVTLLYPELRRLAGSYMRNERADHTLQATALVNEAYARLMQQDQRDYESRAHFMVVAARVMRRILIDHARSRNAKKRGQNKRALPLDIGLQVAADNPSHVLAVDEALLELEQKDSIKARLIEMRFFGGLTAEDSAEVLQMPVEKVRRHLRVGQAWLKQRLDTTAAPRTRNSNS